MGDEMLTQEWFYAALTAVVALAGLVGAVVSWGIARWLKHRERPEPEWVASIRAHATVDSRYGISDQIDVNGVLVNGGDGAAFNVALAGVDCRTHLHPEDADVERGRGLMGTGDKMRFSVEAALDKWDSARVVITWTEPPTRLRKRRTHEIRLRELTGRPTYSATDPETGVVTQVPV